ncbi:MAG: P1 family peptidase [Candidatus Marinimicrobia bacterium]|nr:P1 family peptidase [Candidatus Neomarinimicrobiota bacterium]MBT4317911.1 P1 family peptidase [Candidatus Neomarinimicrobiota bacterium]MBT4783774.1 P1 family peptidase [Candidatus Neomarinimicrobiota bacterium]MBT5096835.1 P1 family peptidase [Candidatus Neomarinimicrobiota bacterium]MBT7525512.1 P1 family peptidase [Candidatus Neomarinimicrobiota bacterium]
MKKLTLKQLFFFFLLIGITYSQELRPRDMGVQIGIFKTGKWNAITDVDGVQVGHETLIYGDSVRTGVTIIKPHGGNLFENKVMGSVYVTNGFGKAIGFTQVEELGTIETPIGLTNTLNIFMVANSIVDYMIAENPDIRSVNPVVGETNDSGLNDIQGRHVTKKHVFNAIKNAKEGPVKEGSVGAGTGTRALGFKGGIGTASRVLPKEAGSYKVGVLVQTNFGGSLMINGAPVGRELLKSSFSSSIPYDEDEGSCMIVIATNAPLSNRNLKRMAKRVDHAFGRVGAYSSNGSGDYVIIFSTANILSSNQKTIKREEMKNRYMNGLFAATVEATEEAIINSLFMADAMDSKYGQIESLPIDETMKILKKYKALNWNEKLYPWKK